MHPKLYIALRNGDIKGLHELLEKGISIKQTDEGGVTPLHVAAAYGHIHMVEFLLKNKYSHSIEKNDRGDTALLIAAHNGYIPLVEYLLKKEYSDIREKNNAGITALVIASSNGDTPMVEFLLSRPGACSLGRDISVGGCVLPRAAMHGRVDTVTFFLNQGAYIDLPMKEGRTVIQIIERHSNKIALPILKASAKLIEIAEKGSLEPVEPLIDILGKGLNARRHRDGNTALHLSIQQGNKTLTKALFDRGASIEITNHANETPFQLAFRSNNPDIIALAYELLTDVNIDDLQRFQKANALLYELLIGGHILLQKNELGEINIIAQCNGGLEFQENEESRTLRLRAIIKHLMLSNSEDKSILGKIIAEYALGDEHSMTGIKGITGSDVESQLTLIDKMREMNLEIQRLKMQSSAEMKLREELAVERERVQKELEIERLRSRKLEESLSRYKKRNIETTSYFSYYRSSWCRNIFNFINERNLKSLQMC